VVDLSYHKEYQIWIVWPFEGFYRGILHVIWAIWLWKEKTKYASIEHLPKMIQS